MHNPLTLKLERLCGLSAAKAKELIFGQPSFVAAHDDILSEGDTVCHAKLLLSGIACQYKLLRDGRRAITAFVLPGDFTNHQVPECQRLDYSVGALTPCKLVDVPLAAWRRQTDDGNVLANGLSFCMVADFSIQRAWLANISQRPADKRMAHLLCELRHRLAQVDLADAQSMHLPIIQQDLADALGLSVVHVNRVIQAIKEMGLIRIRDRTVLIADLAQLEAFAEFDPSYLNPQDRPLPTAHAAVSLSLAK